MVLKLKKKDKIYLLTKNLKTRKKNNKFNYIKVRLFFIKAKEELLIINLIYPKILKYILHFIYCYCNL